MLLINLFSKCLEQEEGVSEFQPKTRRGPLADDSSLRLWMWHHSAEEKAVSYHIRRRMGRPTAPCGRAYCSTIPPMVTTAAESEGGRLLGT